MSALDYVSSLPFPADVFQRDAAAAIDEGATVVVTAPTGSGKTVVAEAAIARALGRGERAAYTTPLKALSNQKYGDFRASHGAERVGLLTGDNTINPGADIVVMTTEVLRNMMYAGGPSLESLGVVVLDEVHYLQDRERGGVWEEIIVHLERSIPLVCLSATVANGEEFAAWVEERRGPTVLVQEWERPVPLESSYLVRDRWDRGALRLQPMFHGERPNERLARMLRSGGGRRYTTPRRHETCDLLRRIGLLPAIYFIFSRAGCDAAATTVVDRGLVLTGGEERSHIREVARARLAHLSETDRTALGYDRWLAVLSAGVAAHHAGLVPAMKETVEELFAGGSVKLVFATETLALGINMPARTVVIESLSKFTGDAHELLQPGDYTQLTGRAGRRGIDTEGTAIVLHSAYVDFGRAAGIAGRGSHPLESSFRPTYNMAVNLVARYPRREAEELLEASFAGFRHRSRAKEAQAREAADRSRLAALRSVADAAGQEAWERAAAPQQSPLDARRSFATQLRAGDVLEGLERAAATRHVVVARSGGGRHPRLVVVDDAGRLDRVSVTKLPDSVAVVGRIDLPAPRRSRDPGFRRLVAATLSSFRPDPAHRRELQRTDDGDIDGEAVSAARSALQLERALGRRAASLQRPDRQLTRHLNALVTLLQDLGYLVDWSLTDKGERLRRLYNPLDLVLGECLDAGVFAELDGPDTAAVASGFTFEPRREPAAVSWPAPIAVRGERLETIWGEVASRERSLGLPESRPPDPGFADTARRWAAGTPFSQLVESGDVDAGDFVRNCRQLIDLLRQIADSGHPSAPGVASALAGLDRGVVAARSPA